MKFSVKYLSFFVIQTEDSDSDVAKRYKHFQTLTHEEYQDSELKSFLDSEFARIGKRKAEVNPVSESVPTKIGRFLVEPGHELTSNPNYNLFQRIRGAADKQEFHHAGDDLIRMYMDTSAVRGGAFIVALAKLNEYFDDPFLFLLKCDFENKIARISDERSLISRVEMAINAKNIKSIMYPYMPEPGILEDWELKIHQASHARYFEDFLKYVSYEKSKPEIVNDQVLGMVQEYMETRWPQEVETEEKEQERKQFELWSASEKRELQELWAHERVIDAAARLTAFQPELELKLKINGVTVKGQMVDYGRSIHVANMDGRYVVLIDGDSIQFDKGVSPVELLQPDDIQTVLQRMRERAEERQREVDALGDPASLGDAGDKPWDD
ncbi:DUF3900 domain-containing protein [Cohnella pontilimi]|uniref:DUF3900 domain-containing protein n=1 Tax=Cohnella pontilimi TaxID=2564100 RepID=A0A4U0FEU2_9BACL|nr:DUF3900 domain-containing protein [Cohnella pontilimi]TJY41842.1 DUF3900 domain-containing protein [Cohnella pontilimi]